jgi:drug/metabolite transporter (DMT)-like permease
VTIALLAALSFGVAAPIVARAGHGVGPFTTAALLYAGAAASSALFGRMFPSSGAPLGRSHVVRLLLIALFGAAIAPVLLAWGLQRAGATTGSLLLNLEAIFTVLLAWLAAREAVGKRVLLAAACMALGASALVYSSQAESAGSVVGAAAIALATLAWAADNVLTRGLAEQDPVAVVAAKGALGAAATTIAATIFHESLPSPSAIAVLLACGATGYGLSLRLYLTAQRKLGAARTGSVFAIAPFVGAALSWIMGDANGSHALSAGALLAVLLFALGVWLHLTEHHHHAHSHVAVTHEHSHTHDDGHHDHTHEPPLPPGTEHSHVHHHEAVTHDHEHAPDIHHDHTHEDDHEHDHAS